MSELQCCAPELMLKGTESNLGGGTIASVVITGLVVVFIGLILLIICVSIYGKIFDSINKSKDRKSKAEIEQKLREAAKGSVVPEAKVAYNPPTVEDGISDEIVAVIAAAVAAMSEASGKKLVLKSVSRQKGARSSWAQAGIAENTRPF